MSKIHYGMEDDYINISIILKSQMLCDVMKKYKKALTANLEITVTDDVFTFRDNQYSGALPYLPIMIVGCLLDHIQIWVDRSYISNETAEALIKELSDNALELSNSVYEMEWINTFCDYFGNIKSVESAVMKDCNFIHKNENSRICNTWNSDGLSGIRKTIYEYVAKNFYMMPRIGSVLHNIYTDSNSLSSYYQGDQFKNAMLKLSEEEFICILDSLVEDGYLGRESDGVNLCYCLP